MDMINDISDPNSEYVCKMHNRTWETGILILDLIHNAFNTCMFVCCGYI